jgi:hypothetical protein
MPDEENLAIGCNRLSVHTSADLVSATMDPPHSHRLVSLIALCQTHLPDAESETRLRDPPKKEAGSVRVKSGLDVNDTQDQNRPKARNRFCQCLSYESSSKWNGIRASQPRLVNLECWGGVDVMSSDILSRIRRNVMMKDQSQRRT